MKWSLVFGLCIVITMANAQSNVNWYIGNTGSEIVPGTLEKPLDFKYFMRNLQGKVSSGDSIFFMAGTYLTSKNDYSSYFGFRGTEGSPIVIMPYNYGRVVFKSPITDANLLRNGGNGETSDIIIQLNGSYVRVCGMIVTADESLSKTTSNYTSLPVPAEDRDVVTIAGVYINGPGNKFINGVVHNVTASGLNSPESGVDGEFYGNIVFNIGNMERSESRDKGHGHLMYFQNNNGRKTVENNLMFKSYGNGLQFYSASGAGTGGSDIRKNIIFMSTSLSSIGAENGRYNFLIDSEDGSLVDGNVSYHYNIGDNYNVGYVKRGDKIVFTNNNALDGHYGILFKNFNHVTAKGNYVVMDVNNTSSSYGAVFSSLTYPSDGIGAPYEYDLDNNSYISNGAYFSVPNSNNSFEGWKTYYGYDQNSIGTSDKDLESLVNKVFVFKNKYEIKRAHIAIYNHQRSGFVSVNPNADGTVLEVGDPYWLYDVEDLRQPIQQDTYQGGDLMIPTNQTSQFPLYGTDIYAQPVHSRDNFGAFLLIGRPLPILENGCQMQIDKVEPEICYEDLTVSFTLTGECNDPVNAVLWGVKNEVISQFDNVRNTIEINIPELCESCNEGTYTIRLESGEQKISKTFDYKPLQLESCLPEQTTGVFDVKFYSPVNDKVVLSVIDAGGIKLINDSIISATKGDNIATVDISGYEKGTYSVSLVYGKRSTLGSITKIDPPKELEVIRCEPDQTFTDFKVTYISPRSEAVTLRIFNSANTEVYVGNLSSVMGEQSEQVVDLGGYVSGAYRTVLDDGFTTQTCLVSKLRPLEIISHTPHETVGDVQVLFYSSVTENIKVEVFDSSEGLVFTDLVAAVVGANNQVTIDLSTQTPGSYSIVLTALSNGQSDLCEVIRQQDPRTLEIISCLPGTTVGPYDVTFYSPVAENITVDVIDESETIVMSKSVAAIVGEKNIVALDISPQLPGVYSTRLTNQANTQSDVCKVTRDEDARPLEIISCSPSSTTGSYVVVFYSPVLENILAEVINISGAIVLTKSVAANIGENNQVELDLASQLPGTYVTRLTVLSTKQTANCEVVRAEDARVLEIVSCSPSSTTGSYSVTFYSPVVENIKAEVINSLGTVVLSESVSATIGENNQITFDLSSQSPGTYRTQLTISSNKQTAICEVIRAEDARRLEITSCSPNPTYGVVALKFYSPQTKTVTLQVANSAGVILLSDSHAGLSGDNQVDIDLSTFDAGAYTIKVDDGTTSDECSVIKQDQVSPRSLEIINYTKETKSNVTIDYYCPSSATVQVEVFDSSGNRMMQMGQAATLGNNTLTFDISSLDSGQYGIRLFDGVSSKSCTVIREEDLKPFSLISSKPDITSGLYEVKFHLPVRQSVSIELKDRTGKVVYKERMAGKVGNNVFKLELSSLNDGEYLVILSDGHVFLERVVTVQGNDME